MNFRFKDIREDQDLNQYQVAEKLHISRSSYSNIEVEKDNIKLSTYNDFCYLFSCSMDYAAHLTNKRQYNDLIKVQTLDKAVIAERLKIIEKDLNKEAQEIAAELGIAPATYSDYKNYNKNNLIQTLMVRCLAENYGYSMDWITGRRNHKFYEK